MGDEASADNLANERRQVRSDGVHLVQQVGVQLQVVLRQCDDPRGKCLNVDQVDG